MEQCYGVITEAENGQRDTGKFMILNNILAQCFFVLAQCCIYNQESVVIVIWCIYEINGPLVMPSTLEVERACCLGLARVYSSHTLM